MAKLFKTKKETREYLEKLNFDGPFNDGSYIPKGTYVLSHGEYQRPDYIPTFYKSLGGWAVKKVCFYYSNTYNVPKDGPIHVFRMNEYEETWIEEEPFDL